MRPTAQGPGRSALGAAGQGEVAEGEGVTEEASEVPVDAEPTGQLEGDVGFGGGGPVEGGAQVGVGVVDGVEVAVGGTVGMLGAEPDGPPGGVAVAGGLELAGVAAAVDGVEADGLQQSVPVGVGVVHDKGLVDRVATARRTRPNRRRRDRRRRLRRRRAGTVR